MRSIRVLGKESVDKAAKQSRFLRRKRVLLPYAPRLALISTLGMGKADWIADILRSYNGLVEGQFRSSRSIEVSPLDL